MRFWRNLGWWGAVILPACGARTELDDPEPRIEPQDPCVTDADCSSLDGCAVFACREGACVHVRSVTCDDGDPCTVDSCDSTTGRCESVPTTYDLDRDGFRAPLAGFEPGAPGACGEDCDDSRAAAHPGGREVCDGLDNDCNGVVDDFAIYTTEAVEPVRLSSPELGQSTPGGLAFDGQKYAASYHGQTDRWENFFHGVGADGSTIVAPKRVATVGSDAFSGPIIWTGSVFATVWEDRRDNDYEIYFNRLDADGDQLGPDVRVSTGPDFSLHPSLHWDGAHFVVVWDDLRDGWSRIYGRLLNLDGEPTTEEIPLTIGDLEAENPLVALGRRTMGMVFKYGPADDQRIGFRTVSSDLETVGTLVEPASGRAVSPTIVASGGRFFVAWHTRSGRGPGDAIWGAVLGEDGSVLVPERQLTFGAQFARSKTWLALGDRLLLVWGADYGTGYDLFSKMLTLDLDQATARVQVTRTATDSVSPLAVFGPQGDVGILFRDRIDGPWHTYFTRLRCVAGR